MTRTGAARRAGLRRALTSRRRDLLRDIHDRIREGRTDRSREVGDEVEDSDAELQVDLDLALLQMRAETLKALDDAIARLDAGKYGYCAECEAEIAAERLRALPFAVRCRACADRREYQEGRVRPLADCRAGLSLDPGTIWP